MDELTYFFTRFNFRTDLFFSGLLCRIGHFGEPNKGYLHFIRQGECLINQAHKPAIHIDRPCVIFSPSGKLHNIQTTDEHIEIFCIDFDFGKNSHNPLLDSVQNIIPLFLDENPSLHAITDQIVQESRVKRHGYQVGMQYLCGYFLILVIRCCLEKNLITGGLLKGLSHPAFAQLLVDIHQSPEKNWHLDNMAERALMSRSKFSAYFKEVMGNSPMDYLSHWRIAVAKSLLLKGLPVSIVAEKVGYQYSSGLTRLFVKEVGMSPTEWLTQNTPKK